VVLRSVPVSEGRAVAVKEARRAIHVRLHDIGILTSSNFSSLAPGYFVVFSGIYGSEKAARNHVSKAAAKGYRHAYPRLVRR